MKICKRCGTPQNDTRFFCIDCGRPLGKSLSAEEAERYERDIKEKMDAAADRADVFHVSRTDKILGIIGIVGLIAACILFSVSQTELNHIDRAFKEALREAAMAGDPFSAIEIVDPTKPRQPSRADYLDNTVKGAIFAIAFFLESCALLLFPRFIWSWRTLGDRLQYAEELTPSAYAEKMMEFSKYGGFVIGCIALAYAAWMYF